MFNQLGNPNKLVMSNYYFFYLIGIFLSQTVANFLLFAVNDEFH